MQTYCLSLLGFGDCLITLSLLENLGQEAPPVLGTGVTQQVNQLLNQPLQVESILPDVARFNTLRQSGLRAALVDFLQARKAVQRRLRAGDRALLERGDLRHRLLLPAGTQALAQEPSTSVYNARRQWLEQALGHPLQHRAPARPGPIQHLSINPCARFRRRNLGPQIVQNILGLCRSRGWQLSLIDPTGEYASFAKDCVHYLARPALKDAVQLLRQSDVYLGPDSFFLHVAHYFGVPHFGFYYPDHLLFMTPGMEELGNWCTFQQAMDPAALEAGLGLWITQAAGHADLD